MLKLIKKLDHKFFFPYLDDATSNKYFVFKSQFKYPYIEASLLNTPERIKSYFEACIHNWTMEKFHFHYTDGCFIEPTAGWAITRKNEIIPQSIWNYYIHKVNKPYFFRYKIFPKRRIQVKSSISLPYAWNNYWHFYNDILGNLKLADEAGLPFDTPIIVPYGLQNQKYFKQILTLSDDLSKRNWMFQDSKTLIYSESAHFFCTFWDHRENFDSVLEYIQFNKKLISNNNKPGKKIFIGRNRGRGRNILNMQEVQQVLAKYSFEVLDCDELDIKAQIDVFQDASYVIGIHGAGLTNIIYRKENPLKVLEIFSSDYINPSYYWLCIQYGFDYYSILGSVSDNSESNSGNFNIDIQEFEGKIIKMLQT